MLDPKNSVNITAGIVSDPEVVANGNIIKLRVAIDYAGNEKGTGTTSGYFDVVYYLKDGNDFASKNAAFVSKQINEGKMKKGSQLQILGRLVQERWTQDNQNRSKIVVVAEAMTYVGSSYQKNGESSSSSGGAAKQSSNNVPDEF
jgi:single-stranded DNA-binding protein